MGVFDCERQDLREDDVPCEKRYGEEDEAGGEREYMEDGKHCPLAVATACASHVLAATPPTHRKASKVIHTSAGHRSPECNGSPHGRRFNNVAMTPVPIVTENHDGVK